MPRPAIGDAARTETITVRVTKSEKEALTKVYGTPARGIYAWIKTVTGGVK